MSIKCRICESKFENKAILKYKNMPSRAQFFLNKDEIKNDKGIELDIYQCPYCSMIQLSTEPVSYYRDVIRAAGVSQEVKKYRLEYFRNFIEKFSLKDKKIIEIGCGQGEFLDIMSKVNSNVHGIENYKNSVDLCRSKGLKVYEGFIEDRYYKIENSPYDGFFIMNFLEHLPDPNEFLKGIYENLNEGAIGLIEVPNVDMIISNLMFSEFISDHLLYFTSKTLRLLVEKNGFEILEEKSVWHDYVLSIVVRKKNMINLDKFNEQQDKIVSQINKFIDMNTSGNKKIAIWGASHQALSVIAMSDIKDKIEFIVDSAHFKQNKYTPSTHIKVVSPKELEKNHIDSIIVMAASYSDEVCSIIKNNHPNIKISILRDDRLELR